jgi:hypothetical protein
MKNKAKLSTLAAAIMMTAVAAPLAAKAGILGELLFGSLDAAQAECQAQYPGNYRGTWKCIRVAVARGHTGDMNNSAATRYMATGDMLFARVNARKMDDVTALYELANAASSTDAEYDAGHPNITCNTVGSAVICN